MKVTDDVMTNWLTGARSREQARQSEADFSTLLSNKVSGDSKIKTDLPVSGPPPQDYLNPAASISMAGDFEAAGQVEKTLDLLDRYAAALSNPERSLKDVSIIVNELEDAAENLKFFNQSLPQGQRINSLLDQAAILATVEAIKFKRGDYL